MGTRRPCIGEYCIGLLDSLVSRWNQRDDSNLGYTGNISLRKGHEAFRPCIELFDGLVDADVDLNELLELCGDDVINLGVYPRFLPPALAQAGLHDFVQHVSPDECGGGLAGGADEAG